MTGLAVWITPGLLASLCGCGPKHEVTPTPMDDAVKASFEAFQNRTIYTVLDPKTLASIADADLEQAVVDYACSKLDGHYDEEARVINALPEGTRALYMTWAVEAEVNNGGFNQYYWNTRGLFAEDAVAAFQFFGADKHAALMKQANQIHNDEAAAISEFQERGTLEAFSESYEVSKLGPLDDRFYQLSEDLSALRVSKIRASPELFSGR